MLGLHPTIVKHHNAQVVSTNTNPARQLKPAAKVLELGNLNWHLLRHSNATLHDSTGE
jgi:hypothetical protein